MVQKLSLLFLCLLLQCSLYAQPSLVPAGNKLQLMVKGKPFLIMGGETANSRATTLQSMESVWPRMKQLNLNTLIVPVYWELLEPEEGEFDFQLIDGLLAEARRFDLKLVLMWFGSWKNSMSSHVPAWVKLDQQRFPRAVSEQGVSQEIVSPFYENNLKSDLNAYSKLMSHLKQVDTFHTVVLIQVENEIGMLPSARDYSPLANRRFGEQVPQDLIDYLELHSETLNPEMKELWVRHGSRKAGSWEEVFGEGLHTDELFMAWYFARYTGQIAAAGKSIYNLPVYVNAALNRPGRLPGEYPSAGPLPHLLDVWKAGAPAIDFYAPDFYNPDFKHWNDLYVRQGNPLFIPEHVFDASVAAKALYAFGHYEALGFSPFSIEQNPEQALTPKELKLARVYALVAQLKPLLDKYRGCNKIEAVLLDKNDNNAVFRLGDYEFTASHTYNLGWEPGVTAGGEWEQASAIVIQTAENEFYYAGFGVSLTFRHLAPEKGNVGILKAESGNFRDGRWEVYQHLNGDQTHQGRHIRSFIDEMSLQRFVLYTYE